MTTQTTPFVVAVPPTKLPTAAPAVPMIVEFDKSDAQVAAAKTIIGYGESGLGKSTNARFAAQYWYELSGKPVRLVAAEDSSKEVFQPLIDLGIVQAVFLTKAKVPLLTMRRLTRGEWPLFRQDGTFDRWSVMAEWAGDVSAYIFEGLSTMAEQLLEDARENGRFLREQKADAFEIGTEKFATSSQTAYGFVQSEMLRHLKAAGMLPVQRVLWTAHESKGVDDDTKEPIRGPKIVGSAVTSVVQKYCGTLLHFDGVPGTSNPDVLVPKVWFVRHRDTKFSNMAYPAKTTLPPEKLGELMKEYPSGNFQPGLKYGDGLDKFLRFEDKLIREFTTNDLRQWQQSVQKEKK